MTHISPAVHLTWAVLSMGLGVFLVFHLWLFDRFECLRWNHGPHSGAFKRIMTYSYLLSVPLLIIYSIGFTALKYTYGFRSIAFVGIVPTPYWMWSQRAQSAILPLYLCLSFAWALEMVTHLEELCFWLCLIHSKTTQQDWFRSPYFKIWAVGSCVAVVMMPLVTTLTRHDLLKCEAFTFLFGSLGSFSLTVWFLPVLWTFPAFLADLRRHDVDAHTLVRLTKFHELNCIRVVCRFLFTVPAVILGIDGVRPHQDINDKMLPTDLLGIFAGIGCFVSSGLTLVIFFPRSSEGEMAFREEQQAYRKRHMAQSDNTVSTQTQTPTLAQMQHGQSYLSTAHSKSDVELDREEEEDVDRERLLAHNVEAQEMGLPEYDVVVSGEQFPMRSLDESGIMQSCIMPQSYVTYTGTGTHTPMGIVGGDGTWGTTGSIALQPNRRRETGHVELGGVLSPSEVELLRARSKRDNRTSVHNLVHHWRSPIEIGRPSPSTWQRSF